MTPQTLADLHQAAFVDQRAWSAQEFESLLSSRHVAAFHRPGGFALIRTIANEVELLTLAVTPMRRRQGIANQLMADWMTRANATQAFLEVAADNVAAQQLYFKNGFAETGCRKRYYKRTPGPAVDALLMTRALTVG